MKIWVVLKQVPDTETRIKISGDGKDIDRTGIKWIVNPYDEFAVEEALKLKEKVGGDSTVVAVSMGPDRVQEAIRTAMAMGADSGVHIKGPEWTASLQVAKAVAGLIGKEKPDIVFMGKQAIDDDALQVPQLTGEFAQIPVATVVTKFDCQGGTVTVQREVEGGAKEVIEMKTPCIVATHKGINTPRYASLPGIMKAKKKDLKVTDPAELGAGQVDGFMQVQGLSLPPDRKAGKVIPGDAAAAAKELVRLLREEAKVI